LVNYFRYSAYQQNKELHSNLVFYLPVGPSRWL